MRLSPPGLGNMASWMLASHLPCSPSYVLLTVHRPQSWFTSACGHVLKLWTPLKRLVLASARLLTILSTLICWAAMLLAALYSARIILAGKVAGRGPRHAAGRYAGPFQKIRHRSPPLGRL